MSNCPDCPDGHPDPAARPWVAYIDAIHRPLQLLVAPGDGGHVSREDAAWVQQRLRHHASAAVASQPPS